MSDSHIRQRTTRSSGKGSRSRPTAAQVVSLARTAGTTVTQFARLRTEKVKFRATDAQCGRDIARFQQDDREGQRRHAIEINRIDSEERDAIRAHERQLERDRDAMDKAERRMRLAESCYESVKSGAMTPEQTVAVACLLRSSR